MTLTDAEVMAVGSQRERQPTPRAWRRWWGRLALPALALVAVVSVAWEWQPWAVPPDTGVRLLVADADASTLTWVDVDTGQRTAVPVEPGWTEPVVVGDGVVVRYPSGDPVLADRVVGYRGDDLPNEIGEADRVALRPGSGLWLVIDGDPPDDGAVALTTAFGQWRSRVFSVPPRFEVAGATTEGLVATRGPFRYRELQLWDVQLGERIRDFGLVIGVREVLGDLALVTTGCLTSGCSTAVLDLTTGRRVEVVSPSGYRVAGAPRLTADGVALAVTAPDGSARLAEGPPEEPVVVDTPGLALMRGAEPIPTTGGWLALTVEDGSVVLWRPGLDADRWPTVTLSGTERMVGVSG